MVVVYPPLLSYHWLLDLKIVFLDGTDFCVALKDLNDINEVCLYNLISDLYSFPTSIALSLAIFSLASNCYLDASFSICVLVFRWSMKLLLSNPLLMFKHTSALWQRVQEIDFPSASKMI
jgi:hypothetical protein